MLQISPEAAQRILQILSEDPSLSGLRVGLQDGGCSGYTYDMAFEATQEDDDLVFEAQGAKVFVHPLHLPYLAGSVLMWSEGDLQSGFSLENPNVKRVCGCGESFAV